MGKFLSKFKRIPLLYQANALFKAYQQERNAQNELNYYRNVAEQKSINVPKGDELIFRLRNCLRNRGVLPITNLRGDLHIFLAFGLNNWESVLPLALSSFGRVTVFEWRSRGFDDRPSNWLKQREAMNVAMLEAFFKANSERSFDVVIGYLSGYTTDPEVLRKMGEAGAVILNFNWDDKLGFRGKMLGDRWTGPAALASVVDLNLTNEAESCVKYLVEGGLAMFWPEAANPDLHRPHTVPFEFDVSFVGGKYGWRPKFIRRLQKMGIKVTCFGNGWESGPLSDEEMVKLYSRSRINLGFAWVGHSRKLMCLKGRDFEVPMSGGLYLTQHNPELAIVYKLGEEIIVYHNEKDCAEKIKYLLNHPEEAEKIRKAGRKRALKEHTWEKRFGDIFKLAGVLKEN